jgi:hypothetical protein
MALSVRYLDFRGHQNPESSIFSEILQEITGNELYFERNLKKAVDLEITSNFIEGTLFARSIERMRSKYSHKNMLEYEAKYRWGFRASYKSKANKRIWFTGENLRPPVGIFDFTYSCDIEDKVAKNVFFPYWYYRLDWGYRGNGFEYQPKPESLIEKRPEVARANSICSFSSSLEPNRKKVIEAINQISLVDEFGRAAGKPVKSKKKISSEYGFQVCTENDLYPNYVTEKIIEAWISGNIPIWSGLDSKNHFNKNAIIDVTGLSSDQIIDKISGISLEEATYMRSLPILNQIPSIELIKFSLNEAIC